MLSGKRYSVFIRPEFDPCLLLGYAEDFNVGSGGHAASGC